MSSTGQFDKVEPSERLHFLWFVFLQVVNRRHVSYDDNEMNIYISKRKKKVKGDTLHVPFTFFKYKRLTLLDHREICPGDGALHEFASEITLYPRRHSERHGTCIISKDP